ncbi:agmatine deiminase [Anaerolineales bacterium HSG6]|nr:agmatine deiminase [Anaerolineales bacterium HSG6]
MKTINSTPKQDNFRMPGEFEPHAGCWMLWPQRPDVWRNGGKPAQHAFVEVATAISQFEPVTMGVSTDQFIHARELLSDSVRVVELTCNDSWVRDCGPTFVVNDVGEIRGVDWKFNAWGGLLSGAYFPWDQDDLIAHKILQIERVARYDAPLILEGGSIHVDGEGTLITTEQCLLNPNRNPELSQSDIETHLRNYLNIETIIWLTEGVYKDETDGHVDNLCCFIRPGVVALTWTDNESDPQHAVSKMAYQQLSEAVDAKGRRLEIHKLHQPEPLYITEGEGAGIDMLPTSSLRQEDKRLAGSYVNFYIANGGVVMPVFNDPHDKPAFETLQQLFPNRRIVTVPGREILLGGGNVHCITQQQPATAQL